MPMIDVNTAIMLGLLTVKSWAATIFYVMAIIYIWKKLKIMRKKNG